LEEGEGRWRAIEKEVRRTRIWGKVTTYKLRFSGKRQWYFAGYSVVSGQKNNERLPKTPSRIARISEYHE